MTLIVHEVRMASRGIGTPTNRLSDTRHGGASQAHLKAVKKVPEKTLMEGLAVNPEMTDEEFDISVALELAWHKEREQFEIERTDRKRINEESAQAWKDKVLAGEVEQGS